MQNWDSILGMSLICYKNLRRYVFTLKFEFQTLTAYFTSQKSEIEAGKKADEHFQKMLNSGKDGWKVRVSLLLIQKMYYIKELSTLEPYVDEHLCQVLVKDSFFVDKCNKLDFLNPRILNQDQWKV